MVAVFGPRGCFIAGGFERSLDFELLEAPGLALRFSSMLPLLFLDRIKISKTCVNVWYWLNLIHQNNVYLFLIIFNLTFASGKKEPLESLRRFVFAFDAASSNHPSMDLMMNVFPYLLRIYCCHSIYSRLDKYSLLFFVHMERPYLKYTICLSCHFDRKYVPDHFELVLNLWFLPQIYFAEISRFDFVG